MCRGFHPDTEVRFLTLGILVSAWPLAAQETADEDIVRVTARVIDGGSKEGLLGAVIEVAGEVDRYVTGVDGRAEMEVPKGRYTLTVRRGGYEVLFGDLDVFEPGEFTLPLDPVKIRDSNATATLEVRVMGHESGGAIGGARVSILEGPSGVTDGRGNVEFSGLDLLVAQVSVEMSGYANRTAPVALHPFRTATVRVAMTVETAAPEPIEVTVRTRAMDADAYSNYVRRRGERAGAFTRRMLDELAVDELSDAFATLQGFRVERLRSGEARLVAPSQCTLDVRVDGIRRRSNWTNIDVLPVSQVERAEVHLLPQRGCGVVMIWTRR